MDAHFTYIGIILKLTPFSLLFCFLMGNFPVSVLFGLQESKTAARSLIPWAIFLIKTSHTAISKLIVIRWAKFISAWTHLTILEVFKRTLLGREGLLGPFEVELQGHS